jgi:anti-sigma factor RsiW
MDNIITSQIGRLVAFVLTPILLPVAAVVANWAQDALGLDLNGADLTAYVVTVVAGVALGAWQWLKNRGEWEKAVEVVGKYHDSGEAFVDTGPDPVEPLPLSGPSLEPPTSI